MSFKNVMIKQILYSILFIMTVHFIFYYMKVNIYDLLPVKDDGIECNEEIDKLKETLNEFKSINPL